MRRQHAGSATERAGVAQSRFDSLPHELGSIRQAIEGSCDTGGHSHTENFVRSLSHLTASSG